MVEWWSFLSSEVSVYINPIIVNLRYCDLAAFLPLRTCVRLSMFDLSAALIVKLFWRKHHLYCCELITSWQAFFFNAYFEDKIKIDTLSHINFCFTSFISHQFTNINTKILLNIISWCIIAANIFTNVLCIILSQSTIISFMIDLFFNVWQSIIYSCLR